MQASRRFSVLGAALALTVAVTAQNWRSEAVPEVGIEFEAPSRLERLPMQLGDTALYHRARLRPKDDADFVQGQYYWSCDVYVFGKQEAPSGGDELPPGVPPELAEQLQRLMASMGGKRHRSFKAWLESRSDVTIVSPGKKKKGKSGRLDFQHWVWREKDDYGPAKTSYCEAAVYEFADREVALVIEMPLESEKHDKPKSKWTTLIDRIVASGREIDPDSAAADSDQKRDKYADTPAKQEALAAAKKNIQGLQGWDYFTQPNYIVLYSWDFEKPDQRGKAKKDAIYYASRLEKMRELYIANYPLDATGTKAILPDPKSIPDIEGATTGGPPTTKPAEAAAAEGEGEEPPAEKLGVQPYSVFRLCATYDQFMKYGQSPPGVVGWFSPASKELVVFLGGDQMMGTGATETVTYHEGWHQYADFYFHHPETKRHGELHRWFDEGHGDYFGSFRWGQSGWKYVGSKMRYEDVKQMVRAGDYVPWKELVHWDRRRFYSQRAPYYYAQAFSMIDFLRRGEKSKGWQPRWGEALDLYRKVMLVHGDSKRASDTAFLKFTDEDWKAIEDAWKAWVGGPQFLSGK
ncbi:MAG: DUF1570 domain-containing protein [Planctomycetes bacterium]|nr:DUF1570 domain-containing protein [Planctomycetota bacterium]